MGIIPLAGVGGAHAFDFAFAVGALPHAGLGCNPRPLTLLFGPEGIMF